MRRTLAPGWLWFVLFSATASGESNWPQFRGPDGQGHSHEVGLPLEWSEHHNVVWKIQVVGRGWSSPVVANGKIWLTSATRTAAPAAVREAKIAGTMTGEALDVAKSISLWALEIDLESGDVLRQVRLFDVQSPQPIHSLNSYASPTPVHDAGRLYCHFGDYGTACLDTSAGNVVWRNRLSADHRVGPGSSPVLYGDLLILTCDGADRQYVVALDKDTGEIVWRRERPPVRATEPEYRKSFCTPLVIHVSGEDQLVVPAAQWCIAYQPTTGKEIWRVDHGRGFSLVPRPVFDGKRVFFCSGFGGTRLYAVRPNGRGDVTDTHVEWTQRKQIPTISSPILVDGRIYTISDSGIANCFDSSTGESIWKERIAGNYAASPLQADGRIYFCSQEGRTTVIAPGDEYQELARNDLEGQLMASPIAIDGDLLLRTDTHLYRLGGE